jgi:hypothetical protein
MVARHRSEIVPERDGNDELLRSGGERAQQAFLVKLWLEADDVGTPASRGWRRGSVEHLESRRRLYFSDVAELLDFDSRASRQLTTRASFRCRARRSTLWRT